MKITMKINVKHLISILLITFMSTTALALNEDVATLRDGKKIDQQETPNRIPKVVNSDVKQARNYPMQPPIIPHQTRNYEVNLNNNKCMSCHSRHRTEESQAPMVSVTHFMNRDGNFLAEISPRRYFCNQCHVTQKDAKPLVENTFIDMNTLMKTKTSEKK